MELWFPGVGGGVSMELLFNGETSRSKAFTILQIIYKNTLEFPSLQLFVVSSLYGFQNTEFNSETIL